MPISTGEILVVFIAAIIIIGPKQIPTIAKQLGQLLNKLKKTLAEITSPPTKPADDTKKITDE